MGTMGRDNYVEKKERLILHGVLNMMKTVWLPVEQANWYRFNFF